MLSKITLSTIGCCDQPRQYNMMLIPLTALLLIVVPIAFNATFFLLQKAFAYPDILRQPTEIILRSFKEGGAPLRRLWYAFAFSAVLFTPVPVLVYQVFQPDAPWFLAVGTVIGVLAGVFQTLGLIPLVYWQAYLRKRVSKPRGRLTRSVGRNVKQFQPGDEIWGDLSFPLDHGAFAEYVCS